MISILKKIADKNFPRLARRLRFSLETWRFSKDFQQPADKVKSGYWFSGRSAMSQGYYEPVETEIITRILPHVDVFINVGANIGYYVCLALSTGKRVIAFEPIEQNLQFLCKNITDNGWEERAEIFPIALTSKAGIINIYGGVGGASIVKNFGNISENHVRFVPASTLDNIIGARFSNETSLLLIDVDGAEAEMIRGADSFLRRQKKPIVFLEITTEFFHDGRNAEESKISIFDYLWSLGYESWTVEANMKKIDRTDLSGGGVNKSVYNFLFMDSATRTRIFSSLQ